MSEDPGEEFDWTKLALPAGSSDDDEDDDPLWRVAENYQQLKRKSRYDRSINLEILREMAIEGILRRTLRLLGHMRRKTRLVRRPWSPEVSGDVALIETIDNLLGKTRPRAEDLIVETREEKPLDLVLLIDTSLSMTGRKIALCAVAAAVLAYRLDTQAFGLLAFGSTAKTLKPMGEARSPKAIVGNILDAPILGYTNIECGLGRALAELRKGRSAQKVAVLLSDGKYTQGADPEPLAARFRRLEVFMTEDHNMDRDCCLRMARAGHGHLTEVRRYRQLPERMLGLLRKLQH